MHNGCVAAPQHNRQKEAGFGFVRVWQKESSSCAVVAFALRASGLVRLFSFFLSPHIHSFLLLFVL